MASTAQHLLGQLVDGRFPLRKLLGVSANSAVFLTDLPNPRPSEPAPEAAIKLIPEDPDSSEQQLQRWSDAASLSHPGLLRILHFGRCAMDGSPCLYVVMELASENLGDLLQQRALTADEASGMMAPVLAALDFLHEKGLVHAGLKPSNILAVRDAIKLSTDRVLPAGEAAAGWKLTAPYAPPESLWFPASDLWSLGISLYETLTQYLPQHDSSGHYVLPQLPAPFAEIIHGALVEDPTERITLDAVRSLLDPAFVPKPKPVPAAAPASQEPAAAPAMEQAPEVSQQPVAAMQASAAAAGATAMRGAQRATLPNVDPLSVPLSPVSPPAAQPAAPARIPVSSLPHVNASIGAPRRVAPARGKSGGSLKFFILGAAATLVLAALIVPRLLRESADSSPSSLPGAARPNAARAASSPAASAAPAKSSSSGTQPEAPSKADATSRASAPAAAKPVAPPPAAARTVSRGDEDSAMPEVVHQVLPEVSQKARNTIRGTVRINVRVQLNADGSVSSAELDSPAVSQFFANLALKAAQQWRFAPSSASSALLRFDFTNSSTNAMVAP